MRSISIFCIVSLSLVLLSCVGCEEKAATVDLVSSIESLKAEAAKMDVDELRELALIYRQGILDNREKLIDAIPSFKEGAEDPFESEINEIMLSIKGLTERHKIYYDRLVWLKADVSGLSVND